MNKVWLIIFTIFSLAACATTQGYKQLCDFWVGVGEVTLVERWGVPDQSYETGGKKFIVYSSNRNVYLPGLAPTYQTTFAGNKAYTRQIGGSPAMNINKSCITTFELEDSKVISYSFEGNDCLAQESY